MRSRPKYPMDWSEVDDGELLPKYRIRHFCTSTNCLIRAKHYSHNPHRKPPNGWKEQVEKFDIKRGQLDCPDCNHVLLSKRKLSTRNDSQANF